MSLQIFLGLLACLLALGAASDEGRGVGRVACAIAVLGVVAAMVAIHVGWRP